MYRLEAARSFKVELGGGTPLLRSDPATVKPSGSSGEEIDVEWV